MNRDLKQTEASGLEGRFLKVYIRSGHVSLIYFYWRTSPEITAPAGVRDSGSLLLISKRHPVVQWGWMCAHILWDVIVPRRYLDCWEADRAFLASCQFCLLCKTPREWGDGSLEAPAPSQLSPLTPSEGWGGEKSRKAWKNHSMDWW